MDTTLGPGDDPLDALKALKAQRATPPASDDPLEQLKAMKTAAPSGIHAEYASGRLAGRMQRENANDRDAAALDDGSPSLLGKFGRSLAATGANIAQGIPGMEAVEAGARSVVRRQPYREALGDIRGETSKIPTALRVTEQMAGGLPVAMMLPGSAAASGALIGGADQALSADPDQSFSERALRTAGGAAGGALLGKAAETAGTVVKAAFTKNPASLLLEKQAARAQSAKGLYDAALAEGRAHEATPAIKAFLADPDIQHVVEGLQGTHALQGVAPEDPRMLDAIYKTLSDQAAQAKKGLDALTPNKPNIGRFRLADIKAKQQALVKAMGSPGVKPPLSMDVAPEVFETAPKVIPGREPTTGPILEGTAGRARGNASQIAIDPQGSAASVSPRDVQGPAGPAFQLRGQPDRVTPGVRIETPGMRVQTAPEKTMPAMMPTYEHAVQDYAKRSAEIDAVKQGYEAYRGTLAKNLPTAKNLTRKTPEAFAEWVKTASPEEIAAARNGILGGAKLSAHGSINPLTGFGAFPSLSKVGNASPLLRIANTPSQEYLDVLRNLGLLTAGNSTSP